MGEMNLLGLSYFQDKWGSTVANDKNSYGP